MIKYIIVKPELNLTSTERARKISRALYLISRPLHIQSDNEKNTLLFSILTHPDGRCAIEFDSDTIIKVHPEVSTERLVHLFPDVTTEERYILSSYILTTESFIFSNIIPSTVIVRDEQYMIDDGWLPDPSEI